MTWTKRPAAWEALVPPVSESSGGNNSRVPLQKCPENVEILAGERFCDTLATPLHPGCSIIKSLTITTPRNGPTSLRMAGATKHGPFRLSDNSPRRTISEGTAGEQINWEDLRRIIR